MDHTDQSLGQGYKSAIAICLTSLIVGCQSLSSAQAPPALLPESAILINESANLYRVDDLLFRSEQLDVADIPLIKANNIDAIINLRFLIEMMMPSY